MAKKKQKKSKTQLLKLYLLPIALIVSALIVAGAVLYINTRQDAKTGQTSESSKNLEASLDNPNVAAAKAAADKYFKALHDCDVKAANSLRFVPKDNIDAMTKDQCKQDCAGSPTFKFVEVASYKTEEVDGEQVEVVALGYLFTCGNTTRSTGVIMTRDAEENKWLLLSTI